MTVPPPQRPPDMILLLDHPLEVSASGWAEALDETSGHKYYYNTITGACRYECSVCHFCIYICNSNGRTPESFCRTTNAANDGQEMRFQWHTYMLEPPDSLVCMYVLATIGTRLQEPSRLNP
jgi:hypothetical protein